MKKGPKATPDSIALDSSPPTAPGKPIGLSEPGIRPSSGDEAIATAARTAHPPAAKATGRQRREGSRPVGYSNNKKSTAASAGTQAQLAVQATSGLAGSSRPWSCP
jgi:hypothetical protein